MDVNPATAAGTALSGQQTDAKASIDETMNDFLLMLTTQLQHQDPLDPLDTAEFTNQLVGFSTVEQLIANNQKLDDLIAIQEAMAGLNPGLTDSPMSYIGKEIEVVGSGFAYDGTPANLAYFLDEATTTATVQVLDAAGKVIWESTDMPTTAGQHEFVWPGVDADGEPVEPGQYFVEARAIDDAGIITEPTTLVYGVVSGVDWSSGVPLLKVGELFVSLDSITAVREPAPPPPAA